MSKDEALNLALQALETLMIERGSIYDKAITAIKEALMSHSDRAQPEQERFLVATIGNWGRVEWTDGVFPSIGDKMYSAPPKWVGLTDEEVMELAFNFDVPSLIVRTVEAKLKEKNT